MLRGSAPFREFLDDVAALGIVPGGEASVRFGVVGSRSNERYWLIPLLSRRAALAGLAMFHPVSRLGHLSKVAARIAIGAGVDRLWARQRIAFDISGLTADYFDEPVEHIAMFTGTDGPHRKSAIEFIGPRGRVLGFAKITRAPHIAPFLRTEAETLRRLEDLVLESGETPKCLAFQDGGDVAIIVTDSRKTHSTRSPTAITEPHRRFLAELARKTQRDADGVVRADLAQRFRDARAGLPPHWKARFAHGARLLADNDIKVGLAHGDFTPWNCYLEADRIYVFDWEYADFAYPLGYDVMKFHISNSRESTHARLGRKIVTDTASLYFDGNERLARAHYQLALLVHSAFYFRRAQVRGPGIDLWPENTQFAALLDAELGTPVPSEAPA
ncbi:MAG: hypothetical protein KDK28_17290 [Maritimibacter sp.]|nr:hypothetical protein [Maritimibacter sp.]